MKKLTEFEMKETSGGGERETEIGIIGFLLFVVFFGWIAWRERQK